MSLLQYLQNAAGQAGLHDALGRWRQKVSQALDNVAARQFAYAKHTGADAGLGLNSNLSIDANGEMRGIIRPGGSQQVWELTAGKIYLLRGWGMFDTFSDDAAGFLVVDWVDDANVKLQSAAIDGASGLFKPQTNTVDAGSMPIVEMIYEVPDPATVTQQRVHLRITAANGTATLSSGNFAVTIFELGDA